MAATRGTLRQVACAICGAGLEAGKLFGCYRCGRVILCADHVVAWLTLEDWVRWPLCGPCTAAVYRGPLADLLEAAR